MINGPAMSRDNATKSIEADIEIFNNENRMDTIFD